MLVFRHGSMVCNRELWTSGLWSRRLRTKRPGKIKAGLEPLSAIARSLTVEGLMAVNCFVEALQECQSSQEKKCVHLANEGGKGARHSWLTTPSFITWIQEVTLAANSAHSHEDTGTMRPIVEQLVCTLKRQWPLDRCPRRRLCYKTPFRKVKLS
jgi:hypothetical protein